MEEQIINLASKGTGWLLAVYFFFRYIAEKDKRLEDSKQNVNTVLTPLEHIQDTMDTVVFILKGGAEGRSERKKRRK